MLNKTVFKNACLQFSNDSYKIRIFKDSKSVISSTEDY